MSRKTKYRVRRASRRPPASGRKPACRLTPGDVTTSADELLTYHREFQALFQRREQRHWSLLYLCGQLSNLERKTMEAIVLTLLGPDQNAIRGLQQFIGQAQWETAPFIEHLQDRVATWLGEPDGVVIVDGSGFPKEGRHSVGVAWQYCGHLGKLANCQQGVFLVYASRRGYAFLDERLYLPEAWFGEDYHERWHVCGIPEEIVFRTEPELGVEMIRALTERQVVPFRWVAADESYGKSPVFLEGIEALGKWYLAEVPSDTRVWLRTPTVEPPGVGLRGQVRTQPRLKATAPRPPELRELVTHLPRTNWQRRIIKEGSQGPIMADFAAVRVTPVRAELPGPRSWALFRRTLGPAPEVKYYLSNAPTTCPRQELVRVSGMRWRWRPRSKTGEAKSEWIITKPERGRDGIITCSIRCGGICFSSTCAWCFKKSPALTIAQAHQLVARAIENDWLPWPDPLAILRYHQHRNYAAYGSHRKRNRSRLNQPLPTRRSGKAS